MNVASQMGSQTMWVCTAAGVRAKGFVMRDYAQ